MCAAAEWANESEWEQKMECVQRPTLTPRIKLQQVTLPALARPVNTLYCPCKMYTFSRMRRFKPSWYKLLGPALFVFSQGEKNMRMCGCRSVLVVMGGSAKCKHDGLLLGVVV